MMKIILATTLVAILAVSAQAGNFVKEDHGFESLMTWVEWAPTILTVGFVVFFVIPLFTPLILVSF